MTSRETQRLRPAVLGLVIASLAVSTAALAAGERTRLVAHLDFPVPARDVGSTQLGVGAGLSITQMDDSHVGMGLDLVHHYWPASGAYTDAFDRYLRRTHLTSLEGSTWALSAFQVTAHLKVEAPTNEAGKPWAKLGGGVYRLNLNLDEQRQEPGTYAWVLSPRTNTITAAPGMYGSLGFDFQTGARVALGLDATLHYVWVGSELPSYHSKDLPDFVAFTLGLNLQFGRP